MHRLLVSPAELERVNPELSGENRNHLKVLRLKDGEEIELFDGCGRWRIFRYHELAARNYELVDVDTVIHQLPHTSSRSITLFACVTKGSRWDWTIEKATELGVTRIVPVISERTIVRLKHEERPVKRDRWHRIAEEAACQSDAKWLPEIAEIVDFADSLPLVRSMRCLIGALTNPPPPTIGEALMKSENKGSGDWAVFVGPEGDFTPAELAALLEIATPVSFGSTILRAETAAIYGVSALKTFLDVSSR